MAVRADKSENLRVLIANERRDRLELHVPIVVRLGHEVIAREINVDEVGPVTARKLIDLAAAVVDGHRLLPKQPDTAVEP